MVVGAAAEPLAVAARAAATTAIESTYRVQWFRLMSCLLR